MTDTLVKWPSRGRPRLLAQQFPKWNAAPGVQFLVTLDVDDPSLQEYQRFLHNYDNVQIRVGNSRGKVEAINDGVAEAEWEFLILASDDFSPTRPDYASHLRGILYAAFPDGDGVVQFPDGRRNDQLNTCPVMGRAYFNRFGWIYNPAYTSTHCDDEMTEVSNRLNRVVWHDEVVLRHDWIGATHPADPVHVRNESYFSADARTFASRQKFGFPP
jgi:hypothetical protein